MKPAVGDVTLITSRSVPLESPVSVSVFFIGLIEFAQITLSCPVLIMVALPVMSPKVWYSVGLQVDVGSHRRAATEIRPEGLPPLGGFVFQLLARHYGEHKGMGNRLCFPLQAPIHTRLLGKAAVKVHDHARVRFAGNGDDRSLIEPQLLSRAPRVRENKKPPRGPA
jgi:hypothetical protein